MSDRCYGCCQENCDSGPYLCYCSCHKRGKPKYDALDIAVEHSANLIQTAVQAIEAAQDRKAFEQLDDVCPCKRHRTYKAIRKPTSGCEECWRFYIKRHP